MNRFFLFVLAFFVLAVGCNEARESPAPDLKYEAMHQPAALPDSNGLVELEVNYDLTFGQVMHGAFLDVRSEGITTKSFPVLLKEQGKAALKIKLFHFDYQGRMPSEYPIKEMEKQGFRPATLRELLAFSGESPEERFKHPIVALGSPLLYKGIRHAQYIVVSSDNRKLNLHRWNHDWGESCRFLAVQN